jgi:hypothetical protein
MFIQTITQPRDEWQTWSERLAVYDDPPEALVAAISWDAGDGMVTQLNVWDSPAAAGDMYMKRTAAVIEELGEPSGKPQAHGEPVAVYLRR